MSEPSAVPQPTPSPTSPIIAVYTRSAYPALKVLDSISDFENTPANTLIIAGPNGSENGIVYNNSPFVMFDMDGEFVGDQNWFASLAALKRKTNIRSLFFSVGNSAVEVMAVPSMAKVMGTLKNNGITGIDLDAENWGQPGGLNPMDASCQAVTLAAIQAGLALTAAPYNQQSAWQNWCTFVSQNNGSVSWLNVQCYAGGANNDPVTDWYTKFHPPVLVVAGFEASPGTDPGALTPAQAQARLASWQAEDPPNSLAGAFVWDFEIILQGAYSVAVTPTRNSKPDSSRRSTSWNL